MVKLRKLEMEFEYVCENCQIAHIKTTEKRLGFCWADSCRNKKYIYIPKQFLNDPEKISKFKEEVADQINHPPHSGRLCR